MTTSAVKTFVTRPTDSVTAKPLIGPVPYWNSTSAVISVVMLASRIVQSALSKPVAIAARGDFPARSSSRMRSKMSTFASTAMPTVSARPAMPGMVSVASKTDISPISMIMFTASAIDRVHAGEPVVDHHEDDDERRRPAATR